LHFHLGRAVQQIAGLLHARVGMRQRTAAFFQRSEHHFHMLRADIALADEAPVHRAVVVGGAVSLYVLLADQIAGHLAVSLLSLAEEACMQPPLACSAAICASPGPASRSTCSVCWPSCGAALASRPGGVALHCVGLAMVRSRPSLGCSISRTNPVTAWWGSA